jgi:hypothetical protein
MATRSPGTCSLAAELDFRPTKIIISNSPFRLQFPHFGASQLFVNFDRRFTFSTTDDHSVCLDFTIVGDQVRLSELAERATPIDIAYGTYQLFNVDAYSFDADKISSSYGIIPFLIAHSPDTSQSAHLLSVSPSQSAPESSHSMGS